MTDKDNKAPTFEIFSLLGIKQNNPQSPKEFENLSQTQKKEEQNGNNNSTN